MKPEADYRKESTYASEEDIFFRHTGLENMEDHITLADMELRAHLCAALADMSESMRALLGLMGRHNFITLLPDKSFPAYEHIMERMGEAVAQASQVVERSRSLDRRITLAQLPASALQRQ